ncbi:MAG: IS630 family transposase, partial [Candidatus Competibacteraceae bacterium]|nr:IS630 family transposase [Candidatus Competibacteraceae bacterium]
HGSWLNMAGCELAVLAGQCLNRRISTIDILREEIATWEGPRNQRQTKIHWQFGTEAARVKLKRLYPSLESTENPIGPEAS